MLTPADDVSWQALGAQWPNREASRFVDAAGLRWHVQVMGAGPVLLLVHGTGAATHSWRDLLPRLAARWTVVAPDLPGHGFTVAADEGVLSLAGMHAALAALVRALALPPALAVGHSAGAALLARMALAGDIAPRALVGLNPALVPPPAFYTHLLAPVVNAVVTTGGVARAASLLAGRFAASMLRSTNSRIDEAQRDRYARFLGSPAHAHATLTMMAGWDLPALARALPRLTVPLTLVAGRRDDWVPLAALRALAQRMPAARLVVLDGEGHLFHEEHPDVAEREIEEAARLAGDGAPSA